MTQYFVMVPNATVHDAGEVEEADGPQVLHLAPEQRVKTRVRGQFHFDMNLDPGSVQGKRIRILHGSNIIHSISFI